MVTRLAAAGLAVLVILAAVPAALAVSHVELQTRSAGLQALSSYILNDKEAFAMIQEGPPDSPYVFVVNATSLEVVADETLAHAPGTIMDGLTSDKPLDVIHKELDSGSIWLEHTAVNPATGEPELRRSWLIRYDGYIFGAGYYIGEISKQEEEQIVQEQLQHLREHVLDMINAERTAAGVRTLTLGSNPAAQHHAESMQDGCFSSLWDLNGLKPYMRYSLAGGYQFNYGHSYGTDYCIKPSDGYDPISLEDELEYAIEGFMSWYETRIEILDPHNTRVNVGIAWDDYNIWLVLRYEHNYVAFNELPAIHGDILSLSGNVIGASIINDMFIDIYYDPPPHELTRGQVVRTGCVSYGLLVAEVVPSERFNWRVSSSDIPIYYCPDPHDIPPDASAPQSSEEARVVLEELANQSVPTITVTVLGIKATQWQLSQNDFVVSADIGSVLDEHGPGVYTVSVYADTYDLIPIAQYSIFHDIALPDAPE